MWGQQNVSAFNSRPKGNWPHYYHGNIQDHEVCPVSQRRTLPETATRPTPMRLFDNASPLTREFLQATYGEASNEGETSAMLESNITNDSKLPAKR